MLNSKSIGNKIADARRKENLSQAELAKQVPISPQAVGKWERGESMPDITTLNKLAHIFKVDLNYFSDTYKRNEIDEKTTDSNEYDSCEIKPFKLKEEFSWGLNMSKGNWMDVDFSGLKNLKEQLSSANLKNCKFLNSELSGITLKSTEIKNCDFSGSDLRDSKFQSTEIVNSTFKNCSLIDAVFKSSDVRGCDFSESNFEGAEFISSEFANNNIESVRWKFTSFKSSGISNVIFEGKVEDCAFENCSFKKVKFQNIALTATLFKNVRGLSRTQFINCTVDRITHAFLKNGKADLTDISIQG